MSIKTDININWSPLKLPTTKICGPKTNINQNWRPLKLMCWKMMWCIKHWTWLTSGKARLWNCWCSLTPRPIIIANELSKSFPQDGYVVSMAALLVLHNGAKICSPAIAMGALIRVVRHLSKVLGSNRKHALGVLATFDVIEDCLSCFVFPSWAVGTGSYLDMLHCICTRSEKGPTQNTGNVPWLMYLTVLLHWVFVSLSVVKITEDPVTVWVGADSICFALSWDLMIFHHLSEGR